jgi:NADH-quinone oxidoreductase subunit E
MGSCGDAPVMLVNNHQMCSFMKHEAIDALIEQLRQDVKTTLQMMATGVNV